MNASYRAVCIGIPATRRWAVPLPTTMHAATPMGRLGQVDIHVPSVLSRDLRGELAAIVGEEHVLTGDDETVAFRVDWTGVFAGRCVAVVRPGSRSEVQDVLRVCATRRVAVVPQGGNTGLVGGGVPMQGELLISLTRLREIGPFDPVTHQVTVGAGVTLGEVNSIERGFETGVVIASRQSATVGGAIATNAGGVRVLRHGHIRKQLTGIEAVLSDGSVVSHLAGLAKDNTGYDYPGILVGSEGTLAVITAARLQLYPVPDTVVTVLVGIDSLDQAHVLATVARSGVDGLRSAEFFTHDGLAILLARAGLVRPLRRDHRVYLLLEATGDHAEEQLADVVDDHDAAVGVDAADRERLWRYRELMPDAAGYIGTTIKLDVSVPGARWPEFAGGVTARVLSTDPGARVVLFGHLADGNVQVNVVPAAARDGRHQQAVFSYVAALGGSISAEHGIGVLKGPWLPLVRSVEELALFQRIRTAFDPYGVLNPRVLASTRRS